MAKSTRKPWQMEDAKRLKALWKLYAKKTGKTLEEVALNWT